MSGMYDIRDHYIAFPPLGGKPSKHFKVTLALDWAVFNVDDKDVAVRVVDMSEAIMNGGTGVWVDEDRRRRFKPLEARLVAHTCEFTGMGVGLYNDVQDAFKPIGRGVDWEDELSFIKDYDVTCMSWEIDRGPKEFMPRGELNNVQKKIRKKTNRKKKRRR